MEGIEPQDVLLRYKHYQQKKLELSKLKKKLNKKLIPLQKLNEMDESILTSQYTSLSLKKSLQNAEKESQEIKERVVALQEEINTRTEKLQSAVKRLIQRKQKSSHEKSDTVSLQKEHQKIKVALSETRLGMVRKLLELFPIIKVEKSKRQPQRRKKGGFDLSEKGVKKSNLKQRKKERTERTEKTEKTEKRVKKDEIEYFILHNKLPNPNKKHECYYKHSKKTALGYVAQFLGILSGILGTSLPFEMSMVGSAHTQIWRKTVKRDGQKREKRFVLGAENSENSENMGPIAMLNYNIEWLCFSHGWKIKKEDRGNMLKNLYDLVNWPKLCKTNDSINQDENFEKLL
ncbi:uv radiation resistance-associated protein [Anaeramoeba flamelloides]|uniref:Uv radiation resistance-associated protein n=1 Tax=Anaeramoeba flamelloides TaxID=1746091 RepID=A0AAV7ZKC2_9EUKA|nr:uv radiation resistance-associated protein [Anaeramoeba flamelloides]